MKVNEKQMKKRLRPKKARFQKSPDVLNFLWRDIKLEARNGHG
jgi:hypothetical protein